MSAGKLTVIKVKNAKPREKSYKLFDGGGLYLEVRPNGGKWWRLKYRFGGKEKLVSLGTYPTVSLADARRGRDQAKAMLMDGIDPAAERKAKKHEQAEDLETFERVAREWHAKFAPGWAPNHADKIIRRLEREVFPWIGNIPIRQITAPELLTVVKRIEQRGHIETAKRTLQTCGQVFRYAVATGRADRNPAADLKGAIPPPRTKHMAAILEPQKVGELLRAIREYSGTFVVACALRLAPLVFLRPGELRMGEWSEIDFDKAEWRIPVRRMKRLQREKNARPDDIGHIVPLSQQALEILQELYPLTGNGRLIFPGLRNKDRPISDATLTNALRRLGYSGEEMTVHGFRHIAETFLHELGFSTLAIEKQMSHKDRNRIRAVYNHAEYLPERRRMMQAWADYLDQLAAGKSPRVVPIMAAG